VLEDWRWPFANSGTLDRRLDIETPERGATDFWCRTLKVLDRKSSAWTMKA